MKVATISAIIVLLFSLTTQQGQTGLVTYPYTTQIRISYYFNFWISGRKQ